MIVTYVNSTYDPSTFTSITLSDALTKIKDGTFKGAIDRYRALPDGKEKKETKKKLPSFSFNGTFKDKVVNNSFLESSGLFHFDIDHLDDPEADKSVISSYPGIVFLFTSPGGHGLKGAVRIDPHAVKSDADFKRVFSFFEANFKILGYSIDPARNDVRSLCFISHDPNLFYNPNAEIVSTRDTSVDDECISRITRILQKASNGTRHEARLKAARLAGGYIAGGLIDEEKIRDILEQLSDSIADGGVSSRTEIKTIDEFIEKGKQIPIYDIGIEQEEFEAQDWNPNLSSGIDYIIPFPGLARDIQGWILENSIYPQPAISFAATMSILAVSYGRYIAYENIKGNLMFLCMAESGEGKDWPFKCAKKILEAVGLGADVYDRMASGAALIESLVDSPSMLFHIDEFGNYLSSIKNASSYSKEIIDIMTQAYTSADGSIQGKKTKGNAPLEIKEPNLCIFGLATERQVFDGLRTSDLANGSLARYSLLFGVNGQMPNRVKTNNRTPPDHVIEKLRESISSHKKTAWPYSYQLNVTQDYDDEKFRLVTDIKKMMNEFEGDKVAFVPMYGRVAVRCIQQAMLIDQCQSVEVLRWLEKLELASVNLFMKKFLHLGSDNEGERLAKLLISKIKEAGKNGIIAKSLQLKTLQIMPNVRSAMLDELVRDGLIARVKKKVNGSSRDSTFYYWIK